MEQINIGDYGFFWNERENNKARPIFFGQLVRILEFGHLGYKHKASNEANYKYFSKKNPFPENDIRLKDGYLIKSWHSL